MDEKFLKLTNAVYKVLEFFPESDPIKNRAKDRALEIVENPTLENIDILLGYLWIAKTQGWLNSVNYLIISNEYEKIKKNIEPQNDFVKLETILKPIMAENKPKEKIISEPNLPERQKIIVEFLGNNGRAQVMDLQKVLPKITKRTIRRDLDELLKNGKIVRIGEFNQIFYQLGQDRTKIGPMGHFTKDMVS